MELIYSSRVILLLSFRLMAKQCLGGHNATTGRTRENPGCEPGTSAQHFKSPFICAPDALEIKSSITYAVSYLAILINIDKFVKNYTYRCRQALYLKNGLTTPKHLDFMISYGLVIY